MRAGWVRTTRWKRALGAPWMAVMVCTALAAPPHARAQIDVERRRLQQAIGVAEHSSRAPATPVRDLSVDELTALGVRRPDDLRSALLLKVPLRFGMFSSPVVLRPARERRPPCLLVYHAGHGALLDGNAGAVILDAVAGGCLVALLHMPAFQPDVTGRRPSVATLRSGGVVDLASTRLHHRYALLEADGRAALDLFVQPVLSVIDFATALVRGRGEPRIVMAGLSGGGWTTHVAAAVDPRIDVNIPVAGSTPSDSASGDYEEAHPILRRLSYPVLYALGSTPVGRQTIHVLNWQDPCCFARSDPARWAPRTRRSMRAFGGGEYGWHIEYENVGHAISNHTASLVRRALRDPLPIRL